MKTLELVAVLLLLVSAAAAAPSFEIKQSCSGSEEPLFSMYSKQGGNIAEPGYYRWQVCGTGVEESNIRMNCLQDESSVISMYSKQDSHASTYTTYRWQVCLPGFDTTVNASCTAGNAIASVHSLDDTHVAEPSYFENQLCPSFPSPENVTLEVEIDANDVYVSGDAAQEKVYNPFELDYPYISTGEPFGVVSYGDLVEIEYVNDTMDVLRVTQTQGSFLVPNTAGGYQEIEDESEEVVERRFTELLSPSFNFFIPEQPWVLVAYLSPYTTHGFVGYETGLFELAVQNRVDADNQTDVLIRSR